MEHDASLLDWERPAWRRTAESWIARQARRRGLSLTGPIEQPHVRPWSTVMRAPSSAGVLFFKATATSMTNDASLTAGLAQRFPDLVLTPLAVDPARARMLLPDGGARLREHAPGDRVLAHWERLLPRYGEMQLIMSGRRSRLLALGAPDYGAAALPALFERLAGDDAALGAGRRGGIRPGERDELLSLMPILRERCAELAGGGVPDSVQHDDLHDGNVLVRDGGCRIIDWGDASVAHPFGTLGVTLPHVAATAGLRLRDAAIGRLRDAYLEPWTRIAPLPALRRTLRDALQVWPVARALTWDRALAGGPADAGGWHRGIVMQWLREFVRGERRRASR